MIKGKIKMNDLEKYKKTFKKRLYGLRGIVDYYLDEFKCKVEELQDYFHNSDVKNPIGYTGVNSNGIHSGFVSKDVVELQRKHNCSINQLRKKKLLTDEHLFGTTLIGRMVLQAFIDSGFNIEYMVNEWLINNLYLWATVIITREEDKRLERHAHSFEQKVNMTHYSEANIPLTGVPRLDFPESIMNYIYSPYKANTDKFFK